MFEKVDKLTAADVRGLLSRANGTLPGPALAAQQTLKDAVNAGETAFADQDAFLAAQDALSGLSEGESPAPD